MVGRVSNLPPSVRVPITSEEGESERRREREGGGG
jgi:hypothetical protein